MQNYTSDDEISSIPEDEYEDYDKQEFEEIQFADNKSHFKQQDSNHEIKFEKNGIQFKIPQKQEKIHIDKENKPTELKHNRILTETSNFMKNELRPQSSSTYKPIYTKSIHQHEQQQKKYNYKQKSFNTLPKRSDPVARYQQMSQSWKQTKFLQSTNGQKEGRKLQLDTRMEQQKQELKESGMFHRYIAKSQLFI